MATTSLQKQLNEVSQAKGKSSAGSVVKDLLSAPAMQKRFNEVLGKSAQQFTSSIINVVNSSQQLQGVDAMSVISSAMVAATLNLLSIPTSAICILCPSMKRTRPPGSI